MQSTYSYRTPIMVSPHIASINHAILCFVFQTNTPIIIMVFVSCVTLQPYTSFLLTHSAQWHWPSCQFWECTVLFLVSELLYPVTSVWNMFPYLFYFAFFVSWLDNCIFQVLLSQRVIPWPFHSIENPTMLFFTTHSGHFYFVFKVYQSGGHIASAQ